jgi:tetratricopeptide (TPR) repeat protein
LSLLSLLGYAVFDITFQCTSVVFLFFILMAILKGRGRVREKEADGPPHDGGLPKRAVWGLTLIVAGGALFAVYEAHRVFRVHGRLNEINQRVSEETPRRIKERFEEAAASPHVLLHRFYSQWLVNRYIASGGETYLQGAIEQAIALYERGGKNPLEAYNLGTLFAKAGRLEEAEQWFRTALDGFPSGLSLWRNYLQVLDRRGREKEVVDLLKTLLYEIDTIPGWERYYAIDRFLLELMLAGLYERNEYYAHARDHYIALQRRYGSAPHVEAYDVINSKLVRITLAPYLKEVESKIQEMWQKLEEKRKAENRAKKKRKRGR